MKEIIYIIAVFVLAFGALCPEAFAASKNNRIPKRRKKSSVYVVGVYEPSKGGDPQDGCDGSIQGTIQVYVGKTRRPVTLALSAYECVDWEIISTEDARIESVIVNGYHSASVTGVDEELVTRMTHDQDSEYLGDFPNSVDGRHYAPESLACEKEFLKDATREHRRDCRLTRLQHFLLFLRKKHGVRSYRKFLGDYRAASFTIGRQ